MRGSKLLYKHFKSKIFGKISETDFCFYVHNINISRISDFKEILVSPDTLDSCFMDTDLHIYACYCN